MKPKVSLEGAIFFTKLSVRLACSWPSTRHSTKWESAKVDVILLISILSAICLLIPLLMSIYEYRSNSIIVTQSVCFCCACLNVIIKSLVCRIHRRELQILIDAMEKFMKNSQSHERLVLQSYVDGCWIFHMAVTITNYLGTVMIILGPIFFPDQRMPTFAVYPFSIDSGTVTYLVFIHQSIVGFQNSSALNIDCQLAMIMWFAGARLEIIAREIREDSGLKNFRFFVKKHQQILSYATQVSDVMCYIALTSTYLSGIAVIMSSLQLVGDHPFIAKMQYGVVAIVSLINLFICTWPAENMIRVCDLIGTTVYNTSWTDMPPNLMKSIIMILRRSQRPVLVTVGGFLPALSMRFYASFLSGAFSYFTTARLVIMSDNQN